MSENLQTQAQPDLSDLKHEIVLGSGRKVVVCEGKETVEILDTTGEMMMKVRLTPQGPVVTFEGARLELNASDSISLKADRVEIKAKEEAIIESEGTLKLESSENMNVHSSDDVVVVGKKIYLN